MLILLFLDAWVNFAAGTGKTLKTGSLQWPEYAPTGNTFMVFGANGTAAQLVSEASANALVPC